MQMNVATTEGQCAQSACYRQSVVGLQSKWYCLFHFEEELKVLRDNLEMLNEMIARAEK
jgi:hypothetical protein